MKICYFNDGRLGVVEGETVYDVTDVLENLPQHRPPFPRHDVVIANLATLLPKMRDAAADAPRFAVSDVRFDPPVGNPGKVLGAPVNYLAHQQEAEADPSTFAEAQVRRVAEIGLFLKATSSVVGVSEGVTVSFPERRTDHEVELAVVIGKQGRHIAEADALDHVAGYTIGLDMTVRGPEERSLRKSVDCYTVLGPWMVTADEFGDPSNVALSLEVNGEARQDSRTSELLMTVPGLIAFASRFYTLEPGDVIMTGTPDGVGPVVPGDVMQVAIERVGRFDVPVK
ncbi:fumarylacetoacetate hydrolase family protein [Novosphingobium pentaromativorans]|uniref:2-hydroxyhepta-2,4-diene-1,7-dioate isomerase n=1 Tax=Novosphingobium pentaromativorans US6-1 TaxID=1088721 RepID=G6EG99_9SPHN|nr:fumarylacetoacetate hydrolase family protein [Novosphingobium pentaromativorans]AIT82215.1 2-hydroxyhepta-2,4-diene-1,7-dioate isomerase [Novosphingobium pentaromativorans US6-1]EHJ59788.1 2-hydroxyhepta-2,4-diene-1,7-dioate isomerase [Novosphingobium pentaromativorans US6-1]